VTELEERATTSVRKEEGKLSREGDEVRGSISQRACGKKPI